MKVIRLTALAVLVLSIGLGALIAQDSGKKKGTLPPNYGKIGLTDEQKQDIYKILAKYIGDGDDLNKKLKDLTTKRSAEIEKILNEDQKKALKKLTDAKTKKAEEPKKSNPPPQ